MNKPRSSSRYAAGLRTPAAETLVALSEQEFDRARELLDRLSDEPEQGEYFRVGEQPVLKLESNGFVVIYIVDDDDSSIDVLTIERAPTT